MLFECLQVPRNSHPLVVSVGDDNALDLGPVHGTTQLFDSSDDALLECV